MVGQGQMDKLIMPARHANHKFCWYLSPEQHVITDYRLHLATTSDYYPLPVLQTSYNYTLCDYCMLCAIIAAHSLLQVRFHFRYLSMHEDSIKQMVLNLLVMSCAKSESSTLSMQFLASHCNRNMSGSFFRGYLWV